MYVYLYGLMISGIDTETMEVNEDEEKPQDNQVSWLGNIYDGSNIEISEPVSVAKIYAKRDEAIQKYKFRIGLLSSGFLENPELKVTTYPINVSKISEIESVDEFVLINILDGQSFSIVGNNG